MNLKLIFFITEEHGSHFNNDLTCSILVLISIARFTWSFSKQPRYLNGLNTSMACLSIVIIGYVFLLLSNIMTLVCVCLCTILNLLVKFYSVIFAYLVPCLLISPRHLRQSIRLLRWPVRFFNYFLYVILCVGIKQH